MLSAQEQEPFQGRNTNPFWGMPQPIYLRKIRQSFLSPQGSLSMADHRCNGSGDMLTRN
jgi:hypothetical protein